MVGGENAESDPDPEPDAEATFLSSLSPFSTSYLEGPDDLSFPFPPYPITYIHSKYPVHAPSDDIDVNDVDGNDKNADIRSLVIWDMKYL